jgi:hypothetical protein
MNIKDRGNKKWTAMMLIEHRERLKELKEHEDDREKCKILFDIHISPSLIHID